MNRPDSRTGRLLAAIGFVSIAAICTALVTQQFLGMQPCPYCVLQRLVFAVIALVALVAWASGNPGLRRGAGGMIALLGIGGAAAALWQHFVAAASDSCDFTLAERIISATRLDAWLPNVFQARASCAEAAVRLVGVPYEFYSLALFVLAFAAGIVLIRRRALKASAGRAFEQAARRPGAHAESTRVALTPLTARPFRARLPR